MPRISVLQVITFLLLISACVYVANHVARYLLRVDGGYSEWSSFNECSRTCGGGIRLRRRVCSNPYPRLGGRNCSVLGKPIQVFKCSRNPCPVNGGYGNWLPFEPCSKTCGEGTKVRLRQCNQPLPKYGGKTCKEMELGEPFETAKCNERQCPVNGGYSEWSTFGECSVTCGGGIKIRTRECNNPTPDPDGKNCTVLGPNQEQLACNKESCPTLPPTTEPTTTPPTTTLTTAETKINTPRTKSAAKQKNSTVVSAKSEDMKSQPNKEQNEPSELNPTTPVDNKDLQQEISIETSKTTEQPPTSTGMFPDFAESKPSVAGIPLNETDTL